jgi:hypothetical protein
MSNLTATPPEAAVEPRAAAPLTLPTFRLNLMRAGYLLMAVGLALVKWPLLLQAASQPLIEGAMLCILTAISLLAFLGLRYPIAMLPILVFEVLWKVLWFGIVALPHLLANTSDASFDSFLFTMLFVIPIIAVTPWDFVWKRYVTTRGERWTRIR